MTLTDIIILIIVISILGIIIFLLLKKDEEGHCKGCPYKNACQRKHECKK